MTSFIISKFCSFLKILQPLDAGVIQNFKVKYRKSLVKYVLSRINDNAADAEIVQDVNILMAIWWVQLAWKYVTFSTVKRCFEKCDFCEVAMN